MRIPAVLLYFRSVETIEDNGAIEGDRTLDLWIHSPAL